MATNIPLLKAAIYLIKSGYKKEARPLLFNLLDRNPADEVAFLWYVDTMPDLRDRIYTLEDFLEEYPGSQYAKAGLKSLQEQYRLYGTTDKSSTYPLEEEIVHPEVGRQAQPDWKPEIRKEDMAEAKEPEERLIEEEKPGEIAPSEEVIEEKFEIEAAEEPVVDKEGFEEFPSSEVSEEEFKPEEPVKDTYLEEIPGNNVAPYVEQEAEKAAPDLSSYGEAWEAYDAAGKEFTTVEKEEPYTLAEDQEEVYPSPELPAEGLVRHEETDEKLTAEQLAAEEPISPEVDEYVPSWLKEVKFEEAGAIEQEAGPEEEAPQPEPETSPEAPKIDWIDEGAQGQPILPSEAEADVTSAAYAAPTKRPNQASPEEIVQRFRSPEEFPQQGVVQTPAKDVTTKEPVSRKTLIRVLEIVAILIVCCLGLAIIGYFAQPLFLESAETKYAKEMEPVVQNINDWMNGPITSWNQVMDEQVYNGQSTTYRDLLTEQMASGDADVLTKGRLLPIAKDVVAQGVTILEKIDLVTVPPGITEAHQDVTDCITYEIEYMANVINFLQYNVTSDIGASRCGTFTTTYEEVRRFVDSNK